MKHPAKILLLAIGNPARGDDGLGPALADHFERHPAEGLRVLWNYQASVEDSAEFPDHDAVIFVDASCTGEEPFLFQRVAPRRSEFLSSHDLAPEAVVDLACQTLGWRGHAYLLAIRGYAFEPFVERLSDRAAENLGQAVRQLSVHIASGTLGSLVTDAPTTNSDHNGAPWLNANT